MSQPVAQPRQFRRVKSGQVDVTYALTRGTSHHVKRIVFSAESVGAVFGKASFKGKQKEIMEAAVKGPFRTLPVWQETDPFDQDKTSSSSPPQAWARSAFVLTRLVQRAEEICQVPLLPSPRSGRRTRPDPRRHASRRYISLLLASLRTLNDETFIPYGKPSWRIRSII